MSEKTEFGPDESHLRDNYVGLHEATGEPFDRMADRIEEQVGDAATAAKVRALHAGRETKPAERSAPKKATTARGKD